MPRGQYAPAAPMIRLNDIREIVSYPRYEDRYECGLALASGNLRPLLVSAVLLAGVR
jgi:hypothetical protein